MLLPPGQPQALCPSCRSKWELAKLRVCPDCGRARMDCLCLPDALYEAGVDRFFKLVGYRADAKRDDADFAVQNRLIYRVKDRHLRVYEQFLADQLALRLRTFLAEEREAVGSGNPGTWMVSFCPRSRENYLKTGTDQSEQIARRLAKRLELPFCRTMVRVSGREQKRLDSAARKQNAAKGFALRPHADVSGKQILLVDDIVTTGASMAACAERLLAAGAAGVTAVSIAFTERRGAKP